MGYAVRQRWHGAAAVPAADRRDHAADRRVAAPAAAGTGSIPAHKRAIIVSAYRVCWLDGDLSRAAGAAGRAADRVRHAVRVRLDRVFQELPRQAVMVCGALLLTLLLVYGALSDIIYPLRNGMLVQEEGESFIRTFRANGAEWYMHVERYDNGGYQYHGSLSGRQERTATGRQLPRLLPDDRIWQPVFRGYVAITGLSLTRE